MYVLVCEQGKCADSLLLIGLVPRTRSGNETTSINFCMVGASRRVFVSLGPSRRESLAGPVVRLCGIRINSYQTKMSSGNVKISTNIACQ